MAEKFLYLLGAGASAQALPLVKIKTDWMDCLADRFKIVSRQLEKLPTVDLKHIQNKADFFKSIAEKLDWLATECENFGTIDTYAKYLYITDRERYELLKFTLSCYFPYEQITNGKLDKRYTVWLTSILDRLVFPSNVKIVSWNYDFQLQLTARKLFEKNAESVAVSNGGVAKRSPAFIEYYPSIGRDLPNYNHLSLLHLNGIAGFYKNDDIHKHVFLNDMHDTVDRYKYFEPLIQNDVYSRLNFAWEKETKAKNEEILKIMLKDVSILVVIGYSFPFFNREMDSSIFEILQNQGNLKKIYFQDPVRDGQFLRSQFELREGLKIEHIQETNALYIPYEM